MLSRRSAGILSSSSSLIGRSSTSLCAAGPSLCTRLFGRACSSSAQGSLQWGRLLMEGGMIHHHHHYHHLMDVRRHRSSIAPSQSSTCSSSGGSSNAKTSPIPTLSFLATPTTLLESVDDVLRVSRRLLDAIKTAATPQEKHDLIDTTSNVLCLLLDPCEFVRQIHPKEEYKNAASMAFQRGFEFMSEANSRKDLYEEIKRLDSPEGHAQLNEESIKNVVQLRRDMESNGIHLPDSERDRIISMNIRKEELAMKFLTEQQQNQRQAHQTLRELLQCRYELARLLEFDSYAQQQLRGTMLENQKNVWDFLCQIAYRYRGESEKELELVRRYVGGKSEITEEQRARVSSLLRREAEPQGINDYFTVANCIRGIECLCLEVFGVSLQRVPFEPTEVFNPIARKYHLYNEKKEFLGVVLLDMYMNPMKYCQAGHLTLQLGCQPHQDVLKRMGITLPARQYPIVALTCNASAASAGPDGVVDDEKTPMDFHEVTTLFHEFGHAMHTIFGQTTVQNLAGTRSSIDYVETFSQLFEQFLTSHSFLRLWAHHIDTRTPISEELVEKRNAAANLFTNLDRLDQVLLSCVDQVIHGPQPLTLWTPPPYGTPLLPSKDIVAHMKRQTLGPEGNFCDPKTFLLQDTLLSIVRPFALGKPTPNTVLGTISSEHIAGYPGGYYGYLYSLTVARRIWSKKFAANPLCRRAGRELVEKVMSYGAACNPKKTIEAYLGDKLEDMHSWE